MMRGWGANVGADAGFTILRNRSVDIAADETSEVVEDTDRVIGQISLFAISKNRCATLGIVIGPDHSGSGYGTEAVRLMVRYGFVELGLHRIQLGVYAYNDRGIRAYTRAGFHEEARRAETAFHGGQWHDEVLMAILEDDWRAAEQTPGRSR